MQTGANEHPLGLDAPGAYSGVISTRPSMISLTVLAPHSAANPRAYSRTNIVFPEKPNSNNPRASTCFKLQLKDIDFNFSSSNGQSVSLGDADF